MYIISNSRALKESSLRDRYAKVYKPNQPKFSDEIEPMHKNEYIKTLRESQDRNKDDSAYTADLQKEINRVKSS